MTVEEIKVCLADGYEVDTGLVAEALLRRNGLRAIADAIAGQGLVSADGRSRADRAGHPAGAGSRGRR